MEISLSEIEKEKTIKFLSCDRSTGTCVCLLCVSVIFCRQGHIHDPVLLSQDRNYTCFLLLIASISVSAILVARNVITLCCINTRTLHHGPSTTDVPHTCALVAHAKVKWHHTHISTGCSDVTTLRLFLFYTLRVRHIHVTKIKKYVTKIDASNSVHFSIYIVAILYYYNGYNQPKHVAENKILHTINVLCSFG